MNEKIDLTKILKDCQEGTKLYSVVHGEVSLISSNDGTNYPIVVRLGNKAKDCFTAYGKLSNIFDGECILFPSREERSWSKFAATLRKKDRFDIKSLKPFDKVLVRDDDSGTWRCALYSHQREANGNLYVYVTSENAYLRCIPYNGDTKHLVDTNEEVPEYYRYWEE